MSTAPPRIPGRQRFYGLLSGDWQTYFAVFGLAFLVMGFFRLEWWRQVLLAGAPGVSGLLPSVVLLVLAVAWQSLLRKGFLWVEPAALTWLDFSGGDRVRTIGGRLFGVWLGWTIGCGYLTALLAATYDVPAATWTALVCLLIGGALVLFGAARRPFGAIDHVGPAVLAILAVLVAFLGVPTVTVIGILLALCGAVASARSGSTLRPIIARDVGRSELVEGWGRRVVRTVGVTFGDPGLLMPEAHGVGGRPLGRNPLSRLAFLGIRGRSRYATPAVFTGFAVVLAHLTTPALPIDVLLIVAGYLVLIPFGGGLGELWTSPGKRRWLGGSDRVVRVWFAVSLLFVVLAWSVPVLLVSAAFGAPPTVVAWLSPLVVVGAVVRTVLRPPMDFSDILVIDTPIGPMPGRLVKQVLRGPDLALFGLVLLTSSVWPVGIVVAVAILAFGVLR